ncbi:unnamed protein product, partial [Rotaria sp. Silwood1]
QCVQSQDRAAFADQLQNMLPKGQYVMLTKDTPISKNHLEGKLQQGTHVYVSGSETFLDAVENVLAQAGVQRSNIHIKSIEPTVGLLKHLFKK